IYVIVTVEDTVAPIISADEAISYNQGNIRTEAQFLTDIHATTRAVVGLYGFMFTEITFGLPTSTTATLTFTSFAVYPLAGS
ncbi:LapB repeat-containing protein, partial [Listeria monocytogenes]|uniref:LapB repeat-containing protein n=1 Tax=Listeria monocytogenes TaxID=1639 RepID=UPI003D6515CB